MELLLSLGLVAGRGVLLLVWIMRGLGLALADGALI